VGKILQSDKRTHTHSPLAMLPLEDNPTLLQVCEGRVLNHLLKLNVIKASGPVEIPYWFLKELADKIADPITKILNAPFKEQCVPSVCKLADVPPLPTKKNFKGHYKGFKDFRPVYLTSFISTIDEDIVVNHYLKPAELKVIDNNQFGAIPN